MGPAQAVWREKKDMLIHIHTHNINYPTLLLRNIKVINSECIPYKYRIDAEPTQDLRRAITVLKQ